MTRLYVAVVDRPSQAYGSNRPDKDWAAFTGEDRNEVIRKALIANKRWGGQYQVLVGELIAEIRIPMHFEEVPLFKEVTNG